MKDPRFDTAMEIDLITERDWAALRTQTDHPGLAFWWCELNVYGWPTALPDPEPEARPYTPHTRRRQIMNWITRQVGERLVSRTWNVVHQKHMTVAAWEEW